MQGRVFRRIRPTGVYYDKWSAVVDVGRDPRTGKRKQRTKTNAFVSEREAWRWVRLVLGEVDRGEYVHSSHLTTGEYLAQWLPTIKPQIRPSTWESYRSKTETHLIPKFGAIPLQVLAPSHLKRLYGELGQEGSRQDGGAGSLSTRSIRYIHSILRLALRDAVSDGLIQRNVALLVKPQS